MASRALGTIILLLLLLDMIVSPFQSFSVIHFRLDGTSAYILAFSQKYMRMIHFLFSLIFQVLEAFLLY